MNIGIKRWDNGRIIIPAGKYASLKEAVEKEVDNLSYANLRYANLSSANLRSADLRYAKYKEPLFLPDLYSLKLLPSLTKLTYWKYLIDGKSPYQYAKYEIGKVYKFNTFNDDENISCGEGGNVATLSWCLKDRSSADEFIKVEFRVRDICAIPYATDGKFRVKKFKVLRKYSRKQVLKFLTKAMEKNRRTK